MIGLKYQTLSGYQFRVYVYTLLLIFELAHKILLYTLDAIETAHAQSKWLNIRNQVDISVAEIQSTLR